MPDEPRSLRKAIMVNFLNPNPYLFWSTVGASMVTRAWEHSVWAVVAFLVLLYALLVGMQMLMAVLAHRSRAFLGGRAHRWVMRLLSVALLVFAGLLLRDGIARLAQAWSA
jgi:threonine/homoserine/homoserine lactone efflux protein